MADPSATESVAALQHRHATAVRANRLMTARLWGQPILAYNVFIEVDPAAAAALSTVQEEVLRLEPLLLAMPSTALHSTVAFLLPAAAEFDRPKDELWQEHGPHWLDQLRALAATTPAFQLKFRRVLATDAAIIAVADEPNGLSAFRRRLYAAVQVPGTRRAHDLAHATLFRYRTALRDPEALLRYLGAAQVQADLEVRELVVARETTFPFLSYEVLLRIPLQAGSLAS